MKKAFVFIMWALILISFVSFVFAIQENNSQRQNNTECDSEQDCVSIGKRNEGLECTCRANKCYAGLVAECDSDSDCKLIYSNCDCEATTLTDSRTSLTDNKICKWNICHGTNVSAICIDNKCVKSSGRIEELEILTSEQIKELIQEKNRLKFENRTGQECPDDCKCVGVTVKCDFGNETRQMAVYAQSGNRIIITKTINASTQVELYKVNKTLLGVFEGNKTKIIKMTPEQVREKIQEKIQARFQDENITLEKNGYYEYTAKKMTKLFWIFPLKEKVQWSVDPETGEITKTKTSWWGFLARDVKEQALLGADCGTVTPGTNDQCCQNKGYDLYNAEKAGCVFSQ